MSWRDRLTDKGSFRGVDFFIETDSDEFAPRTQLHEYPKRDEPYVEQMGKGTRKMSISAVIIGADYDQQRDRLIDALAAPGAGTLLHPLYGTLQASVISASKRETTKQGGKATFSIVFVQGGDIRYPVSSVDTVVAVTDAAAVALVAAAEDFEEEYSVLDLAEQYVADLVAAVDEAMAAVNDAIAAVTDPISALIRAPANLAAGIMGGINDIKRTLSGPMDALNIYRSLFASDNNTPIDDQLAANVLAVNDLVARTSIIAAAELVTQIEWQTTDDILAINAVISEAIDEQLLRSSDAVYDVLSALRTAVAADLHTRAAQLPKLISYTPNTTMPALLIAYEIYGDLARADEIVRRNGIQNPGFVTGGEALELLDE